MDILVGVHVRSDWPNGINAALVSLDDRAIKNIIALSKKAGKHQTVTEYDGTPDLGESNVESLVLAHACNGVDVGAPAYTRGLHDCIEAITNNVF